MKRFLKEPLVHFLLLGGLLFLVGAMRDDGGAGPTGTRIAITPGVVDRLLEGFRMTWRRPPTEAEFRGLMEDHLKEEVLYREAVGMGLDQGDQIIRRRMRQKLEFMTADFVGSIEPTEEELLAYLQADPVRYREDAVLSFRHVYLRSEDDPEAASDRAMRTLDILRADPEMDPLEVGDSFLFPAFFGDITELGITNTFGPEFKDAVLELPVGEWGGPVPSAYGLHVVRVDLKDAGRIPELAEIRDAVYRDLVSERTRDAEEAYFQGLLSQYTVTVEWPEGMEPVDVPGVVR
jgi:hypothetical protein